MRTILPIMLVWRDKTIDCKGDAELIVPGLYIRKGRTLTIANVHPEQEFNFIVDHEKTFGLKLWRVDGSVRVAKKPREITREDLKKHHAI